MLLLIHLDNIVMVTGNIVEISNHAWYCVKDLCLHMYILNCFLNCMINVLGLPTPTKVFHSLPQISLHNSALMYCALYKVHQVVRFLLYSLKDELWVVTGAARRLHVFCFTHLAS